MKARPFIVRFLLAQLALFGLAVLLVSHGKMLFMSVEYPMWKSKEALLERIDDQSTVLLGDSRAMAAFIPAEISPGFVNLALGGGSPIESWHLLRALLARATPRAVVLSFAPYHYELADTFWERTAKFDKPWLTKADIEAVLGEARRLGDTRTIEPFLGSAANTYPMSLRWDLPSAYKGDLVPPPMPDQYWRNRREFAAMIDSRGHHLFGNGERSAGLPDEVTDKPFTPSPLMRLYIDRMLQLCASKGIPVTLVTTPLPQSIAPRLEAVDYPAAFDRYIASLPDSIDKRRANLTFAEDTQFGDSSHLNEHGAQRFSARQASALRESRGNANVVLR